ncbi:MAG: hypothetical protein BGO87_06940 [Flavobacteriia bacterium 40-80]|nr:MAG: hypothetical protein BGO87_06940 [Flavobacteriia bacterium 40-80]
MGLFSIFKKKEDQLAAPKGFHTVTIKEKIRLTADSVKLIFDIPAELKAAFEFTPGQYINLAVKLNKQDIRRSYSICSGTDEELAVGIKKIENGLFSTYAVDELNAGDEIWISGPMGNFKWNKEASTIIAFAAGSGITPILSIAKAAQKNNQQMQLYYGNQSVQSTMFRDELAVLTAVKQAYYYSREKVEGAFEGRLTKEAVMDLVKADLPILRADAFYICGPQEMVESTKSALTTFGVPEKKIHFELFEAKVDESKIELPKEGYKGKVAAKVIVDQEEFSFEMDSTTNVLQKALENGADAPYSCRGGVCSSCKCKIIEGSAEMRINFTLTDSEIQKGYILSCQAYPTSEKLIVSFDE